MTATAITTTTASGLPMHVAVTLDSMLAAGVLSADELGGLATPQLCAVAALAVRASCAGEPFDAPQALAAARALHRGSRREVAT